METWVTTFWLASYVYPVLVTFVTRKVMVPDFFNLLEVNTTVPADPVLAEGPPEMRPLYCPLAAAWLMGLCAKSVILTVACTFLPPAALIVLSEVELSPRFR
jgi:hypothetical protein